MQFPVTSSRHRSAEAVAVFSVSGGRRTIFVGLITRVLETRSALVTTACRQYDDVSHSKQWKPGGSDEFPWHYRACTDASRARTRRPPPLGRSRHGADLDHLFSPSIIPPGGGFYWAQLAETGRPKIVWIRPVELPGNPPLHLVFVGTDAVYQPHRVV